MSMPIMMNLIFWALPIIFFLFWVRTTTWASVDAQVLEDAVLEYKKWNPILVFTFFGAWWLHYLIPIFWVGLPLLVLAWIVPILVYCLAYRNPLVEDHQKVLTGEHLRYWFATKFKIGKAERIDPRDVGAVKLVPTSKDSQENTTRNYTAREAVGYIDAKQFVDDVLARRADVVMLDFTTESVGTRFMIDGLWAVGEPMTREQGDAILESLKLLCGLNPEERGARQVGKFIGEYTVFQAGVFKAVEKAKGRWRKEQTTLMMRKLAGGDLSLEDLEKQVRMDVDAMAREKFSVGIAVWTPVEKTQLRVFGDAVQRIHPDNSVEKRKCTVTMTSAGTPTGERVLFEIHLNKVFFKTLAAIGMRPKMEEKFRDVLKRRTGIFCFCGAPATGMRTTVNVALETSDRLTREFVALENEHQQYDKIENMEVTTYDLAKGDDPCVIMDRMFHREPDVFVLRDLPSKDAVKKLFDHSLQSIEGIISLRSPDCFESLFQLIKMEIPAQLVGDAVNGVVNQRLVRKLCEHCREAVVPNPQMQALFAQVGIPAEKVEFIYQQPTPDPERPDDVCPECGGNGFVGRTAIFEFLEVTDDMRKLIASGQATPQNLRAVARQHGMTSFQEEGIALLASGVTSFAELQRVFKGA